MSRCLIALLLTLITAGAQAECRTTVYTENGRTVVYTTCCTGGTCTTVKS